MSKYKRQQSSRPAYWRQSRDLIEKSTFWYITFASRYKHLAVEHFFLALDIWRKCPLPRVSRGHFSKVYRWINVAKTYKFFSGASPPNPQFFSPQLCDETHQLNFEYLSLFIHSWKVLTDEIHQLTDECHQLTVDLSMKLALRIFWCLRIVIKLGVQTFFAQIIFSHWLALHNHSENFLLMIYSVSECML